MTRSIRRGGSWGCENWKNHLLKANGSDVIHYSTYVPYNFDELCFTVLVVFYLLANTPRNREVVPSQRAVEYRKRNQNTLIRSTMVLSDPIVCISQPRRPSTAHAIANFVLVCLLWVLKALFFLFFCFCLF